MTETHRIVPGLVEPSGPFSQVTVAAGTRLVSVAGQVALDSSGTVVGPGDAGVQARRCLENIDAALRHVGASSADVVKVTVFLTDVGDRAAVADARTAYFGGHEPAATLVEVSALAVPGCIVEIEATAVLPLRRLDPDPGGPANVLYELRNYHAVPGRLPALHDRFERHTLGFFERHGIVPVGFWTTVIGPSANTLTYILAWESLAAREAIWNGFAADPEWLAVKAETEKDGPLVELLETSILAPTSYSRLR